MNAISYLSEGYGHRKQVTETVRGFFPGFVMAAREYGERAGEIAPSR
jgi:hypothetical protein